MESLLKTKRRLTIEADFLSQEFSQADAASGSKTWMFLQQLLNKHEILFLFRLTKWVWIRWVSIQKRGAVPSLNPFLQRSPLQAGL